MNISKCQIPLIAVILADRSLAVEDTMASFALSLQDQGRAVRGLLTTGRWEIDGTYTSALVDVASCRTLLRTDCLRAEAKNCAQADNESLPEAIEEILSHGTDLALLPRFALPEVEEQCFFDAVDLLMTFKIPVMTTVSPKNYATRQGLAKRDFILLPPSLKAMFGWIEGVWRESGIAAIPLQPSPLGQIIDNGRCA